MLEALRSASILCVGDAMLDRYISGEVERISPEAPVPVLHVQHTDALPGGAANAARNAAGLGARVHLLSVSGDDAPAAELEALCPFSIQLVKDSARSTPTKTRFVAAGQQLLRADTEVPAALTPELRGSLIAMFREALPQAGAVLLCDYAKGTLMDGIAAELISIARETGTPVVVDPKQTEYRAYRGATLIKPNVRELREASGMELATEAEIVDAARDMLALADAQHLLVTRGAAGMLLVSVNGEVKAFPAMAREVFDVTGAGDTVAAALAAGYAAGLALHESIRIANTAAGIVVGKRGAAVATGEEIANAMVPSSDKVVALEAAVQRAQQLRAVGRKVGFTNGCFDLLHPGHISLLEQARARCDFLVVGLNTDASVRDLKGPTRPVQQEWARALVLASLRCVDLVVLFDDPTPERLIRAIRPDLLVKGRDYQPHQVVGADLVASWGGELYLAELLPGQSTTATVQRLAR